MRRSSFREIIGSLSPGSRQHSLRQRPCPVLHHLDLSAEIALQLEDMTAIKEVAVAGAERGEQHPVEVAALLELAQDVLADQQAGDGDAFAIEVVRDWHQLGVQATHLPQPLDYRLQDRR